MRSDSSVVGHIPLPRISHRRVLPSAAIGFSLLWGAVFGISMSQSDGDLAVFGVVGMLLTALLYRQQTALQNLAETDSLTGITNHRGFQQALRRELRAAAAKSGTIA